MQPRIHTYLDFSRDSVRFPLNFRGYKQGHCQNVKTLKNNQTLKSLQNTQKQSKTLRLSKTLENSHTRENSQKPETGTVLGDYNGIS